MSLWLCLRLHHLPLQALSRDDQQILVITTGQRVIACSDLAAEYGVQAGQRSGTAKQLLEGMKSQWRERDPSAEHDTLKQLLSWAYGFSPKVQCWRDNCLQLEIGGCLTLFGGLSNLLTQVLNELGRRGFHAEPGIAETCHAAWLLSHSEAPLATDPSGSLLTRLTPLRLSLLEDFSIEVTKLEQAGIRTFGELLSLPSRSLSRRCSVDLRLWLARLTGAARELVEDYQPPNDFNDALWLGFEIRHQDELQPAMNELLQRFCAFLCNTQLQATHIEWRLLRLQGTAEALHVRSDSAGTSWQNWQQLSALRLSTLAIGRDIEGIALLATNLLPQQAASEDLFADKSQRESMQALVDRLRSRLGLTAITHVGQRGEHLPEHCVQISHQPGAISGSAPSAQRPFWLLPQPQPISECEGAPFWKGTLKLCHGPERIEDYWWQQPTSRDYYIAEREKSESLWIFQDRRSKQWYLHGLFD